MSEPITAVLGREVDRNGVKFLVVRIIENSIALFENFNGTLYTLTESYVELRGPNGEPDFIILSETMRDFPQAEKQSTIKALNPLTWRTKWR